MEAYTKYSSGHNALNVPECSRVNLEFYEVCFISVNPAMPTDTGLPPDEKDSGPEHGTGDPVQGAGAQGEHQPRNIGESRCFSI
jgi:hypothetical protein